MLMFVPINLEVITVANKIITILSKFFAVRGALSEGNAKSKSTIIAGAVGAAGALYSSPPATVEEWVMLLVSVIVGLAGFVYRENH